MKNEDLHYYISHYGDFSPVNLTLDEMGKKDYDFIFTSSEKSGDVKKITTQEKTKHSKEEFYF